MSRAFVKEDVDLPKRSGRKQSVSGGPPGATNYITARGAKHLRDELQKLSCRKCQQRAHHRTRAYSASSSFLHPKRITLLCSSGSIPGPRSPHSAIVGPPPSLSPKTRPLRRRNAEALPLSNNPG